ncbi:carboxymuconolactone decarboxylase family protein [Enterococcus rivorum]|uniref:Alkylhydroperoxidase n=1 Tax=Enterococcus rivorum TaxID=762845 RepID=A0A1E5L1Q4_9ENTE|nr:carboxymuconolactone decarboxylase family protein [Enterococcus rivorum]MBP2098561.1 AhpD family alkylhydroperoxidase [Enterococcus rivorum]OEH83839.1 alkylhydroperoxidase [Enterococcus rivorum]
MNQVRFFLNKENKAGYQKIGELDQLGKESSINDTIQELIKIYVSQLNGCVFCIDLHSKEALSKGETLQRVLGLSAWEEAPFYKKEERVVLAFAKEVTFIHRGGVSNKVYKELQECYSEKEIGELLLLVTTINTYNRVGITCLLEPKVD